MRDAIRRFDAQVSGHVEKWPTGLKSFFLFITALGDPLMTVGISIVIVIWGVVQHNVRLAVAGSMVWWTLAIGAVIKMVIGRERPPTEYAANMLIQTFSFPSGHTSGATIAYGLLAYIAWHTLPQPWSYAVVGLMAVLIVLVGVSRVYLGAHFASDVVAGWLLGLLMLFVVIYIIKPFA
jgi:membrane-associated phospholipid phosphatase